MLLLAPSGAIVPSRISGSAHTGFQVDYVPTEVGTHMIHVEYADSDIQGSPFSVEVYDASRVKVGNIPDGTVNQPIRIEGNIAAFVILL